MQNHAKIFLATYCMIKVINSAYFQFSCGRPYPSSKSSASANFLAKDKGPHALALYKMNQVIMIKYLIFAQFFQKAFQLNYRNFLKTTTAKERKDFFLLSKFLCLQIVNRFSHFTQFVVSSKIYGWETKLWGSVVKWCNL